MFGGNMSAVLKYLCTAFLILVVPSCGSRIKTNGMSEEESRFFKSPEESVEVITKLIQQKKWPELSTYYDLSSSFVDRKQLISGEYFYTTEQPELAHPAGFWRYKHPFPLGYQYKYHIQNSDKTVIVYVGVEIDDGMGLVQISTTTFLLHVSVKGYQLSTDEAPHDSPPEKAVTGSTSPPWEESQEH